MESKMPLSIYRVLSKVSSVTSYSNRNIVFYVVADVQIVRYQLDVSSYVYIIQKIQVSIFTLQVELSLKTPPVLHLHLIMSNMMGLINISSYHNLIGTQTIGNLWMILTGLP